MNGDVVAFLRLTFAMVLASACAEIGLLDGVRGLKRAIGGQRAPSGAGPFESSGKL
jgi:hypothetical protein